MSLWIGRSNLHWKGSKAKSDTTKNSNFQWTDEHQKALDLLKTHLTNTPVLGYPNFCHPFDIEMDPSLQGLGDVFSQKDEHS